MSDHKQEPEGEEDSKVNQGVLSWVVMGAGIVFAIIALSLVVGYIVASANGTEMQDASVLLKVLHELAEFIKSNT